MLQPVAADRRLSRDDRLDIALSKAVSHALRHEPWLYELELDEQGWVPVTDLLGACAVPSGSLREVTREDLARMVASAAKPSAMSSRAIESAPITAIPFRARGREGFRAATGGALPRDLAVGLDGDEERAGLRPMGRQYVHLSTDVEMAERVGLRKAASHRHHRCRRRRRGRRRCRLLPRERSGCGSLTRCPRPSLAVPRRHRTDCPERRLQ